VADRSIVWPDRASYGWQLELLEGLETFLIWMADKVKIQVNEAFISDTREVKIQVQTGGKWIDFYSEFKEMLNYVGVGFHGMAEAEIKIDGDKIVNSPKFDGYIDEIKISSIAKEI